MAGSLRSITATIPPSGLLASAPSPSRPATLPWRSSTLTSGAWWRAARCGHGELYQGRDVKEDKDKSLKDQILVIAPHEGFVPSDIWLRCRKKLMTNIPSGSRKAYA